MDKNGTPSNSDNAQAAEQNPPAQAANSDAQVANETPNTSTDDLQREIAALKREAQSLRKQRRDQEEAEKTAKDAQLKEQGKYKDLAEQHEARVRQLEPVEQKYSQLTEILSGQIKEQIKNWPAEVMNFYPGDDAPIEQRLNWMEKGKALVEKLQQQAKGQQPGNAPNPRPSQAPAENANDFYSKLRASGRYGA